LREASGTGRCYGAFSPQADTVAFVESEECFAYDDASSQTIVINLDNGQSWILSGNIEGGKPYWSPDGEEIVFEVASGVIPAKLIPPGHAMAGSIGEIRVANVESKQVRVLWPTPGRSSTDYCGVATSPHVWSSDGQHLALACYAGQGHTQMRSLDILNVDEDNMFRVYSIAPDDPYLLSWYQVDWSPDGNWVEWPSSYRPDVGLEFYFQNLQNNESRNLLVQPSDNSLWLRWSLDGNTLGAIRTAGEQGYLDLYSWGDFNITATVELPQGIDWLDLYWVLE
jgi:Tol biopolymer transport system component